MKRMLYFIAINYLNLVVVYAIVPTKCETCKFLAYELNDTINKLETGTIEDTQYRFDEEFFKKRNKQLNESETLLLEAMLLACRNLLEYHVNPNKKSKMRYSKDEMITKRPQMKTFRYGNRMEIKDDENWEVASADIMKLKRTCDHMVSLHEEDIEDWFYHHRKESLEAYLCKRIILKKNERNCLKSRKEFRMTKELK